MHRKGGMSDTSLRQTDGFTLLETVVATAILVTAIAGISQLFLLGVGHTRSSGSRGAALAAAQAKLEALRSRVLAYGPSGERVTDPALAASPPDSLTKAAAGYVDALDVAGHTVDIDGGELAFERRWAVSVLDDFEPEALAIEVCVYRAPATGAGPAAAEACLSTIRTRQP